MAALYAQSTAPSSTDFTDQTSIPYAQTHTEKHDALLARATWQLSEDWHVARYVCEKSPTRLLACLVLIEQEIIETYNASPSMVSVTRSSKPTVAIPHPTQFINICGKIAHKRPASGIIQSSVKPFVTDISNGFGCFSGLFSTQCNILVCNNGFSTLFRGAKSTADVANVINQTLNTDNIENVHINMMVAVTHMGCPISSKNVRIHYEILDNPHWSVLIPFLSEENENYMCAYDLQDFSDDLLNQLIPNQYDCPIRISRIVVNINYNGNIFFFITLRPPMPFSVGLECRIQPIIEFVCSLIRKHI